VYGRNPFSRFVFDRIFCASHAFFRRSRLYWLLLKVLGIKAQERENKQPKMNSYTLGIPTAVFRFLLRITQLCGNSVGPSQQFESFLRFMSCGAHDEQLGQGGHGCAVA
jgi:hypothetical protein